jgi:hypothetical protein
MDPVNPVYLPDVTLQIHRYGRMMQLVTIAKSAMCASALVLALNVRVDYEISLYILFSLVIFGLLYVSFRRGHLKTGFYSLMYFSSLTGLAGNTLLGWRSGFFCVALPAHPGLLLQPSASGSCQNMVGRLFRGHCCTHHPV